MALNVPVVSVRPTGVVSCGVYRASFRSGSGALAPPSMASRGAITLQAGIGLTCNVVAAGHRMVAMACRGTADLHGGDAPLDPKKANLSEQLKSVAERTLSMLRQLHTPTKGRPLVGSVKLELGMLRDECEGLVEELGLGAGKFSDRTASITLLGLHSRVAILLELFCSSHGSLEESTKKSLQNSMTRIEVCLEEQGVRGPTGEKVAEAVETSLPKLLEILANKTLILLEVTEFKLSKDRTPERLSVSMELKELGGRCNQLIEKIKVEGVADQVAVGTLLGLHACFRIVFLFCVRDADHSSRPDCLETSISAGLATSVTVTEDRVKHYLEKEDKKE